MKKILYIIFTFWAQSSLVAQELPIFNPEPQKIIFPAFISGMMPDSTAKLSGDTFIYQLKSQWFLDKPVALGNNSTPELKTPFEVLNELVKAYQNKNANQIIALYEPSSRKKIKELIQGKQGAELLQYYAAAKNVVLLGLISYRSGFMVYSKDDQYGVHENYITLKKGKYYITPLDDGKAGTSWNLGLFLKHTPKPIYELTQYSFPDSIASNDSLKIECNVPPGYWVQAFYNIPRQLIPYRIEDNGALDFNPAPGTIQFYIKAKNFPNGKGIYTFHLSSTNYPVMYVAPTLLKLGRTYQIKIY